MRRKEKNKGAEEFQKQRNRALGGEFRGGDWPFMGVPATSIHYIETLHSQVPNTLPLQGLKFYHRLGANLGGSDSRAE